MATDIIARGMAATAEEGISSLQTQVDTLKNLGRFLSLWDCSTGQPLNPPTTLPYAYKSGDYYRIGVIPTSGSVYIPSGSSYTGAASTATTSESLNNRDIYFYDGTQWLLQKASASDVTWKSFPSTWLGKSSVSQFLQAVVESNPSVGDGYLGPIAWGQDMPFQGNGEVTLTVSAAGVYLITLTSSNVAPYHWEMTAIGTTAGEWRKWSDVSGTNDGTNWSTLTINGVTKNVGSTPVFTEIGASGQTEPSASLAVGGIFFERM